MRLTRGQRTLWGLTVSAVVAALLTWGNGQVPAHALTGTEPDGPVYAVLPATVAGTDYVYVGGDFDNAGGESRVGLARYNAATGALDSTWTANLDAAGSVNALAADDTYLYVGGSFSSIKGSSRDNLARVALDDGTVDSFTFNTDGAVNALDVSGTNLAAGGTFTTVGGSSHPRLAKITALDTTPALVDITDVSNGEVRAVHLGPSGEVVAGGSFTTVDTNVTRNRLLAVAAAGSLASWDPGVNGVVRALEVNGTHIAVGGSFTSIGGESRNNLAMVESPWENSPWPVAGFNPNPNGTVTALQQADRNTTTYPRAVASALYVGGEFTQVGESTVRNRAAGYSTTDTSATTLLGWDPNLDAPVAALGVEDAGSDGGSVFLGGSFTEVASGPAVGGLVGKLAEIPGWGTRPPRLAQPGPPGDPAVVSWVAPWTGGIEYLVYYRLSDPQGDWKSFAYGSELTSVKVQAGSCVDSEDNPWSVCKQALGVTNIQYDFAVGIRKTSDRATPAGPISSWNILSGVPGPGFYPSFIEPDLPAKSDQPQQTAAEAPAPVGGQPTEGEASGADSADDTPKQQGNPRAALAPASLSGWRTTVSTQRKRKIVQVRITPALGRKVKVQRKIRGGDTGRRWKTVHRTNATSAWRGSVRVVLPARSGRTVRYRLVLPATPSAAAHTSRTLRLRGR